MIMRSAWPPASTRFATKSLGGPASLTAAAGGLRQPSAQEAAM
eukprot:CAMPEP_0206609912 /NCGR_PEP_ID=MMETSP0325_2-20121206/54136_1 /ASSEMBLY_ACC=CAM_ASM_000347 /TAXON_ID=2866 /ORGANISM="Crypthecodinium cohnii, Strain Seligo" /LENGTH=42 /DNA_ID= /DNA_START= /DNA_END= /DNA_ORIENTATION=